MIRFNRNKFSSGFLLAALTLSTVTHFAQRERRVVIDENEPSDCYYTLDKIMSDMKPAAWHITQPDKRKPGAIEG